ncbi:MAG: class I SAM-dependent methyltransferase [Candidatus Micrarchaeia archaeon]|jgi:ubiquinone/menaquinone biosynthesis C-methylase UbiE
MARKIQLGNGAFTGSAAQGNPYKGDLGKGVAYDLYEARAKMIRQDGRTPAITTPYREGARNLVAYLRMVKDRQTVLDVGPGTGITAIEVLGRDSTVRVLGVEISPGMLQVGQYKFHQGRLGLAQFRDTPELLEYWAQFREETSQFGRGRVKFILGDIQEAGVGDGIADCAVANQVMHWTDLSKTFGQLHRMLRGEGQVVWNSASHFYDDGGFPSAEFGFRYNDFMGFVMDEVAKRAPVKDYKGLSRPSHDIESIRGITQGQGFSTGQVGTWLVHVDLQTFMRNHVPVFVKQLIENGMDEPELEAITREAIAAAASNPKALADMTHKYDIVPIFESVKM